MNECDTGSNVAIKQQCRHIAIWENRGLEQGVVLEVRYLARWTLHACQYVDCIAYWLGSRIRSGRFHHRASPPKHSFHSPGTCSSYPPYALLRPYFNGMNLDECVAPIPGLPCLTGLYEIENSPR
jgi:hypothetical protein